MTYQGNSGSFLNNVLQAKDLRVKPKPMFKTPPIYQSDVIFSKNPEKDIRSQAQFKVWIQPPTQAYPRTAIKIALVAFGTSVFVTLANGVDDLVILHDFITKVLPEVSAVAEAQKPLEETIKKAQSEFDQKIQAMRTIARMTGNAEEPQIEEETL